MCNKVIENFFLKFNVKCLLIPTLGIEMSVKDVEILFDKDVFGVDEKFCVMIASKSKSCTSLFCNEKLSLLEVNNNVYLHVFSNSTIYRIESIQKEGEAIFFNVINESDLSNIYNEKINIIEFEQRLFSN